MKYIYDKGEGAFVRSDGRGRKLYIDYSDAESICRLASLGYGAKDIRDKLCLNINESLLRTVINNFRDGNLEGLTLDTFKRSESTGFWSRFRRFKL